MLRLSANLSMLYTEHAFLDRFGAAAADGFEGVEYVGPYDYQESTVREALRDNGLTQVLFNLPAGDWDAGERGIACIPGREAEFQDGVGQAIGYAETLGCRQVNCLSGIVLPDLSLSEARAVLRQNLRHAAPRLQQVGIRLLVEPINSFDIPGFALNRSDETLALFEEVGESNLWLQYDIYHMQRMQGELAQTFERLQPRIAHVQIADTPGRHEPGTGEINFAYLLGRLNELNYDGWIGCEYVPATTTRAGLSWRDTILESIR